MKNLKNLGTILTKAEQKKIIGSGGPPPPPGLCTLGEPCDELDKTKICCLSRGGSYYCVPPEVCLHL